MEREIAMTTALTYSAENRQRLLEQIDFLLFDDDAPTDPERLWMLLAFCQQIDHDSA